MSDTNQTYADILNRILVYGDSVETRNHAAHSHIHLENTVFESFPLVTVRRTAWKKALREIEWFFSGKDKCPEELLDWWKGQLHYNGCLYGGYPAQFRYSTDSFESDRHFDQVSFILKELKAHPQSRRLLISLWNPKEMAEITFLNKNPDTPTVCHSVLMQFFARDGKLHIKTYQRSADMLLGVPHNWVQGWAMLLFFAHWTGLIPGSITWMWGDAHIYAEKSHVETAGEIIHKVYSDYALEEVPLELVYTPSEEEPVFRADDFSIKGEVPKPLVLTRPVLL